MPNTQSSASPNRWIRYSTRLSQIPIILGKFLRMFVYQNDWKCLPMAAIIAAVVSLVVRKDFYLTMEGTLKGAFALTCTGIWNGCFNSIQVVCRERGIVKREHRSGMHISSYIVSHMVYQALLCLLQSILTLYVCSMVGVQFPTEGIVFGHFFMDALAGLFLVTFASDMLSLLISCVAKTTTSAMTVMPFVLIFQLVFSGGFFSLPNWCRPIANFTISNYGLKVFVSQADYNNLPMATGWNTIAKLKDNEINVDITPDQIITFLQADNPQLKAIRDTTVHGTYTVGELRNMILSSQTLKDKANSQLITAETDDPTVPDNLTVGDVLSFIDSISLTEEQSNLIIGRDFTIGDLLTFIQNNEDLAELRATPIQYSITIGDILSIIGEDKVKNTVEDATRAASTNPDYEKDSVSIISYSLVLAAFALAYAFIAMIILEFIDKDKR